jgi:alpha-glucosidase
MLSCKGLLWAMLTLLCAGSLAGQSSYDLRSPDDRIEIRIHTARQIRYDVVLNGGSLLENCTLSLKVDDKILGIDAKVIDAKRRAYDHVEVPVVRQKFAQIRDHYNELRLTMEGGYSVVFRAYNEGAAYRFETSLPRPQVKVGAEEGVFNFSRDYIVYYPQEDSFFSHNERKYLPEHLSEIAPEFIATLPAVVDVAGTKVAIAESDVNDYPGLWLRGTGGTGLAATFPPYPLKEEQESTLNYRVTEGADYIAITSGMRTYPWRVLGVAEKDGDLLTNQIVWLLEKPSQVEDTSWIKAGKVVWDWWNGNNVYGVDFKAGVNTATYKYYLDFAAKYGFPYIVIDGAWGKSRSVLESIPEMNIPELAAYAKEKNVGIILWVYSKNLDDNLIPALDLYQRWGIKGIKVDYSQRSDQVMINFYHRVSREAAKRHMLVDFHGDQKPATMTRTWPNLIGTEGVRGLEWNKWSRDSEPKHNVTLPFTRMFLGPMDYTPGAMHNATPATFSIIYTQPMALGTRCQQLAMFIVYDSPLQMLSDSPSTYMREPEALDFLTVVPTEWDETKVLDALIAQYVLVARRNGQDWYVGAMTDWTARDLDIDFSFLAPGNFTMDAYQDGVNADRMASDYKKFTVQVTRSTKLKIHLAPGGGWAARIRPSDFTNSKLAIPN